MVFTNLKQTLFMQIQFNVAWNEELVNGFAS